MPLQPAATVLNIASRRSRYTVQPFWLRIAAAGSCHSAGEPKPDIQLLHKPNKEPFEATITATCFAALCLAIDRTIAAQLCNSL